MLETLRIVFTRLFRPWRWYLRLMLLWIVLRALAPVHQRVLPDEPQTVDAVSPHLCVHTDLINEVDEWKITHSLQLVREMGASTIVEFFPWAYIEVEEAQYNWYQTDRIIDHAEQQGLRVIARMGLVPDWARPPETTLNYLIEDSFDEFADFLAVFAARYAGRVDHLIIWNEPNLAFEWGFQAVDPAFYARLLRAVYEPIHAANPNAVVIAGALAPTLEPVGSPNGMNDLHYLQGMYDAGAASYFDALAVHTYGLTSAALDEPSQDALNFRRAELIHELVETNDNKPVYITESGWNDSPRWIYGVRPSQRIGYTLDALQWVGNQWDWAETMCLWVFRFTRRQGSYRDNFSLVTPDFQIKPIYHAVQAYARGWEGDAALWLPAPVD